MITSSWPLSLLHNDSRTQPLDSMAVWVRRLNSLFPIQPLLTFVYVNRVLPTCQTKLHVKLLKKQLFLLIPADFSASPQLQKVMRSTYQRPLTAAGFNAPSHKPVKTANIFYLTKHRFYRLSFINI